MHKKENHVFSTRRIRILFSMIVILSLLASCQLPWRFTSNETGEEADAGEDISGEDEISTPRQDLPPALVEASPIPDSIISLQQPITLYFNQAMDPESVEAAIDFDPSISGTFLWEGDQVLIFTPDQPLAPDSELHLIIRTSAQAENGKTLQESIELTYQTAENLQVIQTVPSAGVVDVDPESAVFVTFNQPVVALGAEANADPAFSLEPNISGEGEWLNTSTYIFYPSPSMNGGTNYTIELNDSLTSTSGSKLDPDQTLEVTFTTTLPTVLSISPAPDEKLSLDGPIELEFNIRMDPESVEEGFHLMDADGENVAGGFEWDENTKIAAFTPDENLKRSTTYSVNLESTVKSFGGLPIDAPVEVSWTTYPAFTIDPAYANEFESYYGSYGQYKLNFTTPVDPENYKDHITISPEASSLTSYLADLDKSLTAGGFFTPETRYTITLDGELQDVWGGQLGSEVTFEFYTPPATPALTVLTGYTSYNLVFIPAAESELVMQATNINTVTLEMSPISMDDLFALIHPDNYTYRETFSPGNLEVTTQNVNLTPNVSEVIQIPLSFQGEPLSPGVYFLQISSADVTTNGVREYTRLFLVVSENNVVMKIAPEQAIVWVTQMADYAPLSSAPVSVYTTEGEEIANGVTNANGLFESRIARPSETYSTYFSVVGEPGEDNFAFSISTWGQGYSLYEMGISLNTLPAEIEAYVYTDRPIYRPGDTVSFKSILFSRDNGLPVPSHLESITVTVYNDPGMSGLSSTLYEEVLALSSFGTIESAFSIPEDSQTGMYRIELTQDEELIDAFYFDVAEYRKPDFEIEIELGADERLIDQNINAEIQADYYFGLPTSNEAVIWTLYKDEAYFNLPGYQVGPLNTDWLMPTYDIYTIYGTMVGYGETETNDQGHLTLDFTQDDLETSQTTPGSLQEYTLEATITDDSGLPVSQRESILVHPEEFYIGVQSELYFGQADSEFSFSILTVDWNQEPFGNVPLQATFEAIEWVAEETVDPSTPYQYSAQTTFIASANPITDDEGRARVAFTPSEPGTYQLTLESGDAVTQTIIWVSGSGTAVWPRQTQNLIELTPDADEYQPGQTAQVFFPNPFGEDAKALITIERGVVMETRIVTIDSAGYTLQILLTEESAPNVYLSVTLLGKNEDGAPDYRQGIINLTVTPVTQILNVDLVIEPDQTEPGETVSATLTITDAQGDPFRVNSPLQSLIKPSWH